MPTPQSSGPLHGSVISHAIWSDNGRRLADFYAAALGTEVGTPYPDEHGNDAAFPVTAGNAMYVFWTSAHYTAPDWPRQDLPFHMDLAFPDAAAAEERLLELGATKPAFQPGGEHWTVLLDPSGQPLCISQTHPS
ncbi:VOC family protein [Streptomyces venezuelae]|uniref:VOC family protein n=1 Tax=Streptomyces venezuelae TaxID=54571 RepID=UPI00278C82FF|nr:VOC family protein [Streptomyces venezuelae]